MADGETRVDFFVSYTKVDRQWAEWIAWQLEEAGHTVVVQAWDFDPGANFVLEMQRAASAAARTIAVMTPAYLDSLFVQPEWAAAFAQDPTGGHRRFLPVRVQPCEPEGLLKQVVYVDLVDRSEDEARRALLMAVVDGRAKPGDPPAFPGADRAAASSAPIFPGVGVPLHRSPAPSRLFTGRDALLARLDALLVGGDDRSTQRVIVLHGLGGVGKTQTAAEFAARNADRYELVWWIRAEEEQTRLADFSELGSALALPQHAAPDPIAAMRAVSDWLARNDRWLLVLDNAPDPASIAPLIPAGAGGHVLVTSRQAAGWRALGVPVPVAAWEREESVAFLRSRTGDPHERAAEALAAELGDLPLALEQAGAYVDAMGLTLADYQERLRENALKLFRAGAALDYHATVATTWDLAFREVEADAGARLIVHVCALLAPDAIPLRLLDALLPDAMARDQAMHAVLRFSLVTPGTGSISMHRLVQQVVRGRLGETERRDALWPAFEALVSVFPEDSHAAPSWPACVELLPHVLVLLADAESAPAYEVVELFTRLEAFYHGRGEYLQALPLCEGLCEIAEREHGSHSLELSGSLSQLGELHTRMGDWEKAEHACRRALEIVERSGDDRNIAAMLTNLGTVLRENGDLEGAREAHEEALRLLKQLYGDEHPALVGTLSALGATLGMLERPEEGRRLNRLALRIAESDEQHDPFELAVALGSVASDLAVAGEVDEAIATYRRMIALQEEVVGPEHLLLAPPLANLGMLLARQGDLREAGEHEERALAIMRRVLPSDHHNIALCLRNLARIRVLGEDLPAAIELQEECIDILSRRLGPDDPLVVKDRAFLEQLEQADGGEASS